MQFKRLRLSGFKSFVDPTEMRIEEGLTGVVGPNGCGKSNLLEALRWVMGESSAKSMRGTEMEDVIFAGTSNRPARNFADVALLLDNSQRRAPAQFNDADEIEVTRRIERDLGSAYRINGKDVRQKDVQLLFADAATGAHSPALVSQGRIGAIVTSKPTERRAILEEAAGISGLHTRRKEAEQRLRAAETNLTRLDDVLGQMEGQVGALKRQARQAEKYRTLSADIRKGEAILLFQRWQEAAQRLAESQEQLKAVDAAVAEWTSATARLSTEQADVAALMPNLRQEEAHAAAALQRLTLAREELAAEEKRITERREQLTRQLEDINRDMTREASLEADGAAALERLASEKAEIEARLAEDADREAAARAAVSAAETEASEGERVFDDLTQQNAQVLARKGAFEAQVEAARQRIARLQDDLARIAEERAKLQAEAASDGVGLAETEATVRETEEALKAQAEVISAAERVRVEAETHRQRTRLEAEAEREEARRQQEAERQRVRQEAEAEREAVRAKAEAERQRVRQEAEAERDAARSRLEAERENTRAEAEAERQRVRQQAEAERDRIRAEAEAERQAVRARLEAERERVRLEAETERDAVRAGAEEERARIRAEVEAERESVRADAEAERQAALQALEATRESATRERREAEATVASLRTELQTLDRLLAARQEQAGGTPVIDQLSVEPGFEAALGAALAEDLNAPAGGSAKRRWPEAGIDAADSPLPAGARPLAEVVKAPAGLNRRLRQIGVVDSPEEAARLAGQLAAGQRLVSRDGQLWRWDGFYAAAPQSGSEQERLSQRNRRTAVVAELEAAEARLKTVIADTTAALNAAQERMDAAQTNGAAAVQAADQKAQETLAALQARLEAAVSAADRKAQETLAALQSRIETELAAADARAQEAVAGVQARVEAEIQAADAKARETVAAVQTRVEAEIAAANARAQEAINAVQARVEAEIQAADAKARETVAAVQARVEAAIQEADRRAQEAISAAQTRLDEAIAAEREARSQRTQLEQALDQARRRLTHLQQEAAKRDNRLQGLADTEKRLGEEVALREAERAAALEDIAALPDTEALGQQVNEQRKLVEKLRADLAAARAGLDTLLRQLQADRKRLETIAIEREAWAGRLTGGREQLLVLADRKAAAETELATIEARPAEIEAQRLALADEITQAEARRKVAADTLAEAETRLRTKDNDLRQANELLAQAREQRARLETAVENYDARRQELALSIGEQFQCPPPLLLKTIEVAEDEPLPPMKQLEVDVERLRMERERLGAVNLRAEIELEELETQRNTMMAERTELETAIGKLRASIGTLNREGRQRLLEAFEMVNGHFSQLFTSLFGGGQAHLALVESDDPLEAGLEIMASPPGKRLQTLSLLSGGEQALTACALIFAVFLTNPAPICVLDEVDAPLDDANVERFCDLLIEMTKKTDTRFLVVTHNAVTMSRMDRLYGVTMAERGVSQLVSVDLKRAEMLLAAE
ncbi:AAA family ATPase [Pedomonas mirosovicensis]|uniref:AAA family ATPase n=1 Tax=Pedomonas mirosovicensis TaxID=2908641 RepID=UPI00216A96DC|nr:AAA family ATPase [Pedomonas mirosovicensis]MCH8685654.1 AAA family ATPase [Pedomonas mirosovicensis]